MEQDDIVNEIKKLAKAFCEVDPSSLYDYINEPLSISTVEKMRNNLIQIYASNSYIRRNDSSTTITFNSPYSTSYKNIVSYIIDEDYYPSLTKNNVVRLMINDIENAIEIYIYDTFDRSYIQEYGDYVYSNLTEKTYDIIENVITKQDKYCVPSNDDTLQEIIDVVFEAIDFDYFYKLIDDIPGQPITLEEKMKEVGMSYKDFL